MCPDELRLCEQQHVPAVGLKPLFPFAVCLCPAEPFNFEDNPDQTPPIRFREYSFLANERTPKSLKASAEA